MPTKKKAKPGVIRNTNAVATINHAISAALYLPLSLNKGREGINIAATAIAMSTKKGIICLVLIMLIREPSFKLNKIIMQQIYFKNQEKWLKILKLFNIYLFII